MKHLDLKHFKLLLLSLMALFCVTASYAQENTGNASYDDFCKPTVTKNGNNLNKRWQVKGEILNENKLSPESPKSFTPTGDNQEQDWANTTEEILAYPGATFDLKVYFGKNGIGDTGWGSLTVFQLRSDKGSEFGTDDKIFGLYDGSWKTGNSNVKDLFNNINNDSESGASASPDEFTATFPIQIPGDIQTGEMVVVRFIICKYVTDVQSEYADYDGTPCATDAVQLNYCDYIVRIVEESSVEKFSVTKNVEPIDGGSVSVTMNGSEVTEVEAGDIITVTANNNDGYTLESLEVTGATEVAEQEGQYTVTGDVTVTATFVADTPVEKYAQNFGQAVGNASNNRTWANTVFDVESGEKTIEVNYTTSLDSYDVYSDEFVNEENKVEIFADETFDLTVNGSLSWVYTLVYIDWNGDGVFDEEPANLENLGFNPVNESDFNTAGVSDTRKYSVKVPENAKIGETRARIVIGWKGARGFEMNSQEVVVGTTESGDPGQRKNAMARDFLLEIKEHPQATMYNVTVKKPANGDMLINYTVDGNMEEIDTSVYEGESEVYSIPENTVLTITTYEENGYELEKLLPEEGMIEKPGKVGILYEYTVTGDVTIEAIFKEILYGKVSVNAPEETQGSIEIQLYNPDKDLWVNAEESFLEQVEFDTELRAKVEAKTGYNLVSVMKNQEELSTEEEGYYYFTVDAEEITISAEFEAEEYTLTKEVTPEEGGSVSVTINGTTVEGTVKYGDVITVTVSVNKGYLLESIEVTGADEIDGQSGKYQVTGDVTVKVTFTEDTSSINSIENGNVYYNSVEEVLYTGYAKSVKVYDLSGRLVLNTENQENVSLAELAEGVYTAIIDGKIIKFNK